MRAGRQQADSRPVAGWWWINTGNRFVVQGLDCE